MIGSIDTEHQGRRADHRFGPIMPSSGALLHGSEVGEVSSVGIGGRPLFGSESPHAVQRALVHLRPVQPFPDVRTAVLNERLEDAFRYRYPGFRSASDDQARSAAA
jgi:hypothetical protein